mmetsp:Transcript_35324/g.77368  ORF Transcript_35324/g.77368 Transcript_35324/m.77368 type:complete len:289 (+) Transcript_35324:115-981(+)
MDSKSGGQGVSTSQVLQIVLIPWVAFTIIMTLYVFVAHISLPAVWVTILVSICFGLMFMVMDRTTKKGGVYLTLGVCLLLATFLGSMLGMWTYQTYTKVYFAYSEYREYNNVIASESAAAHADAGKIVFAKGTRVDTMKAVGYKDGSTYCVAPISDSAMTGRVEFWAVGVDCCAAREDIWCDSARDGDARSGVVSLDYSGFMDVIQESKYDMYQKAVKVAESQFDIVSSPDAMFVRWVRDPTHIQDEFWKMGFGVYIITILGYLVFCAGTGWAFQALSKPPQSRTVDP